MQFARPCSEQPFGHVAAGLGAGGDGEEGAADVLDVLVEGVDLAEAALDRDELLLRSRWKQMKKRPASGSPRLSSTPSVKE